MIRNRSISSVRPEGPDPAPRAVRHGRLRWLLGGATDPVGRLIVQEHRCPLPRTEAEWQRLAPTRAGVRIYVCPECGCAYRQATDAHARD